MQMPMQIRRWIPLAVLLAASAAAANPTPPERTLYQCRPAGPGTLLRLTFRPDTPIRDFLVWLSLTYCKSVAVDSAILASNITATVMAPSTLTPDQAQHLVLGAIEATGLIVVQKHDTFLIKLGPNTPRPYVAAIESAPPTLSTSFPSRPRGPGAEVLAGLMVNGIKAIDDTHHEIDTAVVESGLLDPMTATRSVRIVPSLSNGTPDGLKLFGIQPGSLYAKLGFANGDRVVAINQHRPSSASDWFELRSKLRDARRFEVELVRSGKPLTLVFTIVP
jgi:hypothetical protein